MRLLLFTAREDLSACEEVREITASGSIYYCLSAEDVKSLSAASSYSTSASFFVYILCNRPCKPHLAARIHGLGKQDTQAEEIKVRV